MSVRKTETVSIIKNQRGFVRAINERSLSELLKSWIRKNVGIYKEQYEFAPRCFIDFIVLKPEVTLIEVKNWFLKIRDILQIIRYLCHAYERYGKQGFSFWVIVGGVEPPYRKQLLENLGVKIFQTKEIL